MENNNVIPLLVKIERDLLEEEMERKVIEELKEAEKKVTRNNDRILKAIASVLGKQFLTDVKYYLDHTYWNYLELVKEPAGKFQEDDEWGSFNGVWIDEHSNGGYWGDEYAGYLYIKLKENLYMKAYYWD